MSTLHYNNQEVSHTSSCQYSSGKFYFSHCEVQCDPFENLLEDLVTKNVQSQMVARLRKPILVRELIVVKLCLLSLTIQLYAEKSNRNLPNHDKIT